MKLLIWQISLGLSLIVFSLALYLMHYAVFEDIHYLCKLSMTSFAFLPILVLFVTLIINQFAEIDANPDKIRADLIVKDDWSEQDFFNTGKRVKHYRSGVDIEKVQLEDLRGYLLQKNNFSTETAGKPESIGA